MATKRVQIPVSFQYVVTGQLVPVVGAAVTVTDRATGNPATIYAGFTGSTPVAAPITDSVGNVPGYVVQGSYTITVGAVGAFAGASLNWEAVRGDGVENYAAGSITLPALDPSVAGSFGIPAGAILEFGGAAAPTGYLLCDGASYATATYPALFSAIGTTFGGAGANFNVPNFTGRFALGPGGPSGYAAVGATGGALAHTHSTPAVSIPAHTHPLSQNGWAVAGFGASRAFDALQWISSPAGTVEPGLDSYFIDTWWNLYGWAGVSFPSGGTSFVTGGHGIALSGHTDSGGGGSTGTGTSGAGDPAYLTVSKVIKT